MHIVGLFEPATKKHHSSDAAKVQSRTMEHFWDILSSRSYRAGRACVGVSNPVEGVVALVVELRKERRVDGGESTREVKCLVLLKAERTNETAEIRATCLTVLAGPVYV